MKRFARCWKIAIALLFALFPVGRASLLHGDPQTPTTAPVVTKVEPPNWWVGLTPDLMVLVSGHGLQATKVACNLPEVVVLRTEATQGGEYLFVWLKFGPQLRSGTAVCRATTATGGPRR